MFNSFFCLSFFATDCFRAVFHWLAEFSSTVLRDPGILSSTSGKQDM